MKVMDWPRRLLRRLRDRRQAERTPEPLILAHYWDGSAPLGHGLRDISAVGAYIYTTERWYLGTILRLTLQVAEAAAHDMGLSMPAASVIARCKVVRHGSDGVGVKFILLKSEERQSMKRFLASTIPNDSMRRPAHEAASTAGQSLVEFALIIPLLFLLIVNAVNFGGFLYAWITVANAARTGAQYTIMGGASILGPTPPTGAQVKTIIAQDVYSLLNGTNPTVNICTNNNGTLTTLSGTCSTTTTPPDPEPLSYVLATVDVTYTYTPKIPLWNFSGLGIHATLPATTIHRQTVMRMIQ